MNKYKLSKVGIDANEGIKRLNNNSELYESMLKRFPEDSHYMDLEVAITENDVKEAFQAAHALKGLAGNLSFNRLYSLLLPLVEDLRIGKMDNVDELFSAVSKSYAEIISVLKE